MTYYRELCSRACNSLGYFESTIISRETRKLVLCEQKRDIGGETFCLKLGDFDHECGKICKCYDPCNGKSGRCRNLENGFVDTGRIFELTKDGLKEVIE